MLICHRFKITNTVLYTQDSLATLQGEEKHVDRRRRRVPLGPMVRWFSVPPLLPRSLPPPSLAVGAVSFRRSLNDVRGPTTTINPVAEQSSEAK